VLSKSPPQGLKPCPILIGFGTAESRAFPDVLWPACLNDLANSTSDEGRIPSENPSLVQIQPYFTGLKSNLSDPSS
jgi:hypothetical protein